VHDDDERGADAIGQSIEEVLEGLYAACGSSNADDLERGLTNKALDRRTASSRSRASNV